MAPPFLPLARKFFENELWTEARTFSRAEAWLDMIQAAAFSDYRRLIGSACIKLERGEVLGSLRYLAARWGWTKKRVEVFLRLLEKNGQIRGQSETSAGTIYLLVNYATYNGQGDSYEADEGTARGQLGDSQGTARGQRRIRKEGEEGKKEKRIRGAEDLPHLPPELDFPEMRVAWEGRMAERKEIGAKGRQTPSQVQSQFRQLIRVLDLHGREYAVRCVERATAAHYQGIVFQDDLNGKPASSAQQEYRPDHWLVGIFDQLPPGPERDAKILAGCNGAFTAADIERANRWDEARRSNGRAVA